MVKVVVVNKSGVFSSRSVSAERALEQSAIRKMSSAKESLSYRETVAAKIPVTYVSKGIIVRESNGNTVVLGRSVPSVKVVGTKK